MQYFVIVLLLTNAATGAISYHYGGRHTEDAIRAEQLNQAAKSIERANEQVAEDQKLMNGAEKVREIIKIKYIKVRADADANINQNPGYSECSLDDAGLRLYNAYSSSQ